jgi:hypothetical protein
MEDNPKILKMEYLSKPLFDHTKIFADQTIFYKFLRCRLPSMGDDLKVSDVE